MFVRFKDLVINGIGIYETRSGQTVRIYATKLLVTYPYYGMNPDGVRGPQPFNFQVNAYGYRLVPTKNGKIKEVWGSWFVNGKVAAIGDSPHDLICKKS